MNSDQRALRDALASTPMRIAEAAAALADPGIPLIPGEWSAREVTLHLAAVDEIVWQPRLDALIAEDFPHWPWVEPGLWVGPGDATFDGALAAFSRLRAATIARIDALNDDGWTRCGLHATYGELDVAALLRIERNHDQEHMAQIRP